MLLSLLHAISILEAKGYTKGNPFNTYEKHFAMMKLSHSINLVWSLSLTYKKEITHVNIDYNNIIFYSNKDGSLKRAKTIREAVEGAFLKYEEQKV